MASFAQFLGRKVTVQYRVGDVMLPASGIFTADSGRSIFLEQHVEQRGKRSYFRWEIPYQYIHRIVMDSRSEEVPASLPERGAEISSEKAAAAIAGQSAAGATSARSLPPRSKTA